MALIEALFQLIQLVFELLGMAVEPFVHLAKRPKDGGSRVSRKRFFVAFLPFFVLAAMVVGGFSFAEWTSRLRRERRHAAETQIEQNLERLENAVDAEGRLVRPSSEFLDAKDPWGKAFRVRYDEAALHVVIEVRSDGPDTTANTDDDIWSARRVARPKKQIVRGLLENVRDVVRDKMTADDE